MQYVNANKLIYTAGQVENAGTLLKEKTLQIGLSEVEVCTLKGKSCIILDFGKELSGGARILTFLVEGDKTVRLRFGESVGETCADLKDGEEGYGATNDHSLRDFCVKLQNFSDMTFSQTGYRFLRIDTLSEDTVLKLKTIVAAVDTDTRAELGTFECDDSLVNKIWNTAAYTLRLCMQNGFIWDGIKRDRLVWIGDLYPEALAAHYLFGDIPETLNCLDFSMRQAPLPNSINRMPTYSLWWILCLKEAYRVSRDKVKFEKYLAYMQGIVEQIIAPCVLEDGTVCYIYNFIDWPSRHAEGETDTDKKEVERLAGVAYLTKLALQAAKEMLLEFCLDCSLCDELIARINQRKYEIHIYKQIAALGVWAGDNNDSMKDTLLHGGAKGLSTFQSYPILTAVAGFGSYEAALSMMKEYYGGMLSVGATTFWEDFDLEWLKGSGRLDEMPQEGIKDIHGDFGNFCYTSYRHSFCHGWSAGVIPYLMETVVGVKTMGAGMRRVIIKPHLSGLKHVKATLPTPYGIVCVEHTVGEDGKINTFVSAPQEVEIIKA